MPTPNQIASGIIQTLALTEPSLDTSIGTVARKIIDAVAASQSEQSNDGLLSQYAFDIDSKTAGDLDDFVALFGLARYRSQRATGVVTFTRTSAMAATRTAVIPLASQIVAITSPPVVVQTVVQVVMAVGQTSVDVPVQAIDPGSQGNVGAGLLTQAVSALDGISGVTNNNPLQYGAEAESDDQLRARFKETVFRNLAGTQAMYRAMALQALSNPSDPSSRAATQVNVLGAKKTFHAQIAVSGGTATTSGALTDSAYIYPGSIFIGANISAGNFLTPVSEYTVTVNNGVFPATATFTAVSTHMPDGIYDLQLDYVPQYSRNDPASLRWGLAGAYVDNRIDVWANGQILTEVTQSCVFNTGSALRFTSGAHDPLGVSRFVKFNGANPSVNDIFVPLGFGPIISVPATLSIDGTTYNLGVEYDIVSQDDAFGYAPNSACGLVWYTAGPTPLSDKPFTITYIYNALPATVQQSIESSWRLVGTDCWVHAGKPVNYRFHLAVVYDPDVDSTSVNTAINTALASFVNSLGFNAAMQVSDLIQVVHNVSGVDNVRFLNSTDDGTNYGIQLIHRDSTVGPVSQIGGRAADVYFDDATYPLFHSSRIVIKARNTFGTL